MERLDRVRLLPDADELDRLPGHRPDRDRGPAAGIAVQLREDEAGNAQPPRELGGDGDRVLTGHRVQDQQDLLRLQRRLHARHLLHHRLVDVEAAGRVQDHDVVTILRGVLHGRARDSHRVLLVAQGEDGRLDLLPHHLKLLDGARAIDVAGGQQRAPALLAQQVGELGAVRRLAAALEADQHDHRRRARREVDPGLLAAQDRRQLLVDDLDDHLRGRQAFEHVPADRPLLHPPDEILDDAEVDVGLQQRQADLTQRLSDIRLRQGAFAAEALEDILEFVGEAFEHSEIVAVVID